jgi:hypothetical protein
MQRSNSDNFGDIAVDPPTPNDVATEDEQLAKRGLNITGLPEGVRDDEREIEKEATSGHKDEGDRPSAFTTRRRRNKSDEKDKDEEIIDEKEEDKKSLSFRDRLRSPLGSGLKLDGLRETISNGVEVKYILVNSSSQWRTS